MENQNYLNDYEEVLKNNIKIVNSRPTKDQIIIWIEEMSELTKELCKWHRVYDENNGEIPLQLLLNLKEEVTDVTVSLDQIKYVIHFTEEQLMDIYKFKTDRALNSINEKDE